MTWQWIPPTALAAYTAVLATVPYWRQNAYMGWALETVLSSNEKSGVRQLGVRRNGPPARDVVLIVGAQEKRSEKVGRGGVISVHSIGAGVPNLPQGVQVTWRGRFGRQHTWRSAT